MNARATAGGHRRSPVAGSPAIRAAPGWIVLAAVAVAAGTALTRNGGLVWLSVPAALVAVALVPGRGGA
jgi:hypothetical protein